MCLSPIRIKNPHLGLSRIGLNCLNDCTAQYIEVPCGRCASCIALKQSYAIQRAQMETLGNDLFMCTLTYNDEMLAYIDNNGYRLRYVDISDFQNMVKRLRRSNSLGLPFRFLAVTEYGGRTHRPHMHCLFSFPKIPDESRAELDARTKRYHDIILSEWRRNIALNASGKPNTRKPIYRPLCTYVFKRRANGKISTTYDFHYVDPSLIKSDGTLADSTDVAFYVTKYLTKSSDYVQRLQRALKLNNSPEEYMRIWTLLRPKALISKSWGDPTNPLVKRHIRKGIDTFLKDSNYPYPCFINPVTGQTFPLAPFYRHKFLTLDDAFVIFSKSKDRIGDDNFRVKPELFEQVDPVQDYRQRTLRLSKIRKTLNDREKDEFSDIDTNLECSQKIDTLLDSVDYFDCLLNCFASDIAGQNFDNSDEWDSEFA